MNKKLLHIGSFVGFICMGVAGAALFFEQKDDSTNSSHTEVNKAAFNMASEQKTLQQLPMRPNALQQDAVLLLNNLRLLPINKLAEAAKVFWARCQVKNNCQAQLAAIKNSVDPNRYNIIETFPENLRLFNETIQYELNAEDQLLEQKIAEIKSAYKAAWGEQAEDLFFDEFAFYDKHLALNALLLDSRGLDLDSKHQLFDDWVKGTPAGKDNLDNYSAAKLFFSEELQSNLVLANKLADRYLSEGLAAQEKQRLARRQSQQAQAQTYQYALQDVQKALRAERNTRYSHLNEADWNAYKNGKIKDFKINFFK